jgi:hypothetical protein
VETTSLTTTADCQVTLRGSVLDREGYGLEGYPVHLWMATEHAVKSTDDQILFSESSGRWQVVLPAGARGLWYVQLHAPDARQVYPPLSAVVAVSLPDPCSRATVTFREQ